MDKATVALAATEDNAAAIAKLQKAMAKRVSIRAALGVVEGRYSILGEVNSDGIVMVIASVPYTGACSLLFDGELIRKDKTPLFAIIPKGKGVLAAQPPVDGVYAIIIGE